ncbi:hypothetical protein RM530_15470 [Algiphilus sp. W345]|uniref:Uncharacterized protein n=1 Tax=Banduia mediterranea TaxID=3075609 RepID=A0ABU2WMG7_9GAMM|nr:hypothetical protein [Algiphilus sp. W345]MDT0498748.1 hypothetical protein [Algiphilus sp. W345]
MSRFMQSISMLAPMLLLSACGSEPTKLNPTPDSVTFTYEDNSLSAVTQNAMEYCSGLGKSAKMRNVNEVDDEKVAIFDCV